MNALLGVATLQIAAQVPVNCGVPGSGNTDKGNTACQTGSVMLHEVSNTRTGNCSSDS